MKLKNQASRDSLLRQMRKQRLNYITILPSLITILNGVCGFASIIFITQGFLAKAGYMLFLAMIADTLDGRVARMSQSTSSFGGQLDSLCDIISFGVAPALLAFKMLEVNFLDVVSVSAFVKPLLYRFIWLSSAAYMSCSAIRLARFNVENEEDESSHMSFIGLPTPAAAGCIVSMVIFHQHGMQELLKDGTRLHALCESAILYSIPFLMFALAILMVTRIRYPHVVNHYMKGKKPFAYLIRILLLLGIIVSGNWQAALVLIFHIFAFSGFLKWVYYKVIKKRPMTPEAAEDGPVPAA